jgi:hypothetical protein
MEVSARSLVRRVSWMLSNMSSVCAKGVTEMKMTLTKLEFRHQRAFLHVVMVYNAVISSRN